MSFWKFLAFGSTLGACFLFAIGLVGSFLTWQVDGMFWYGLMLTVSGVVHKVVVDAWF